MWPGRDVAAYAKSVFSTQFSVTFTFLFFPTFEIAFFEKKRASHSIFLPLYAEHCFRFEWLEFCDHRRPFFGSLAALLANDWRYRRSQIFQALLPFFYFLPCFLIFLKKAFPERKIALEIVPKKDEGALQITVQSMTNATFETVDQVRKAIFVCLTTD